MSLRMRISTVITGIVLALGLMSGPVNAAPPGPAGNWVRVFNDDFTGTTLDLSKWESTWFGEGTTMNNVGTYSKNVRVANGKVHLRLSSSTQGALIHTGYRPGHYQAEVGSYTEARINFSGDGNRIYNWPAWWINSTDDYPAGGEHDIAEGSSSGDLTVNYHDQDSNSMNMGEPTGYWGGAYHTYGIHRKATSADVYWDGQLVRSYPTNDDGRPLDLILNIGAKGIIKTGWAGEMHVEYVRSWEPVR